MIAEKALDAGMIDGISTFESVLESMTDENEPKSTINTHRFSGESEGGEQAKETLNMSDKKPETKPEAITVDREYLDANHPGIVKAIQEESASAERVRIASIDENTIPGHEALATAAKADGTEPGAFALQMAGAEKEARNGAAASIKKEAPKAVKIDTDAVEPEPVKVLSADAPVAERAEAAWEAEEAGYRSVFAGGKESYVKAFEAMDKGQVKLLKK